MRILAYKKGKTCKLLLASLVPSALFAQHAPSVSIPVQTNTQSASEQNVRGLFSPSALRDIFGGEVGNFDFARLQEEAEVGTRFYDIYVNNHFLIHQRVEIFRKPDGNLGILIPAQVLFVQNLRFKDLPELSEKMPMDMLGNVPELITGSSVSFDTVKGTVNISIPDNWYESFGLHGDVVPHQRWTYGIPAAGLNYYVNADVRKYDDYTSKHAYLDFEGQFNLGQWRLIANGSFSYNEEDNDTDHEFDRGNLYLTRVFGESKTRLKLGEIYTQSFYMDSIPLQGIELYDDETMLASTERSYTPVVSGIAQTAARVTVRQFGRVVFERNVPAGPFSFEDLPGLTSGTDLEVTVTEQNGQTRTFTVPYVTTPLLLRAGRLHFNAAVGRWRDDDNESIDETPFVFTGGIGYGLPFDTSIFAGAQISENYQNVTAGTAVNLGSPGAASWQIDHTSYEIPDDDGENHGTRMRLQWTKRFDLTDSYISASWRRYISGRYLTLSETLSRHGSDSWYYSNYDGALRDEVSLAVTQPIWKLGSLSLSGSLYRYDNDRTRQNLLASFTTNWKGATATFSLQHSRNKYDNGYDERETICFVNLSIPLSIFGGYNFSRHSVNLSLQRDDDGTYRTTEGISGTFGENNRWGYTLSATQEEGDQSYYGSISKDAEFGHFLLSVSHDDSSTVYTGSLDGSLIATSNGIFPARRLSGSSVLLNIPNAPDARPDQFEVSSRVGDRILVTGLDNYRINEIAIDPNTIPANVTMPIYIRRFVPADDAILEVSFETMKGYQFVPEMLFEDGSKLPFGTTVRIVGNELLSGMDTVLNERARAYFPSAPLKGVIEAIWESHGERQTCWAPYDITHESERAPAGRAVRKTVTCKFVAVPTKEANP